MENKNILKIIKIERSKRQDNKPKNSSDSNNLIII